MADEPTLNDDFVDLLRAFDDAGVDYVVVGAHALAAYGVVRATGDLDVFVRPDAEVAARVVTGLRAFGAPLMAHGVGVDDFARRGTVYQMGLVPRRIDILTEISGVSFDEAVREATRVETGGVAFRVIGRAALLTNKRASARPKDIEDVRLLEAAAATATDS